MIATIEDFTSHVAAHAGVDGALAERVSRAVLAGIGGSLTPAGRQLVAEELPAGLGAALADCRPAMSIEDAVRALGTTPGHARELIASVCRVLVEELSGQAVAVLRRAAPAGLAALLAEPEAGELPSPPAPEPRRDTLAGGRPGSHHPVSEARAPGGHGESIAANNPHAATKLSSSTGATQERRHETLAEGHPGTPSPLSGSRR